MSDTGSQNGNVTIIRRKKVVKGDGHHGGAWKVAYADFVTAMMAFFLLMWLLNATTEDQRKGIADYFNPTILISRISGGGSDGLNGSSIFTEETYAKMGTGASQDRSVESPVQNDPIADSEQLNQEAESLQAELEESGAQLSEHLLVKMSPEGIVIEIIDTESEALFAVGRSDSTALLDELMGPVASHFDRFGNGIKIVGHTDNRQFRNGGAYDNWDLSAERANTARRMLIERNVSPSRIVEVAGRADTEPLIEDDPSAAQNRRISIIILT